MVDVKVVLGGATQGQGDKRAWDLLVTHYSTPEIKDLFALLYHLFLYSNRTVLLGTFRHI